MTLAAGLNRSGSIDGRGNHRQRCALGPSIVLHGRLSRLDINQVPDFSMQKPRREYRSELRRAQVDLTRAKISDATRLLLFDRPFHTLTMDEIAAAAGLTRTTVYQRFRDKTEILRAILADYAPKARKTLAKLPGPAPTLAEVRRWVLSVAKFVAKQPVPLTVGVELRRSPEHADALKILQNELLEGIGENNPKFAAAARDDADPVLRGHALLLHQQLSYACDVYANDPSNPIKFPLLDIVARYFHEFLSEPDSDGGAARG